MGRCWSGGVPVAAEMSADAPADAAAPAKKQDERQYEQACDHKHKMNDNTSKHASYYSTVQTNDMITKLRQDDTCNTTCHKMTTATTTAPCRPMITAASD